MDKHRCFFIIQNKTPVTRLPEIITFKSSTSHKSLNKKAGIYKHSKVYIIDNCCLFVAMKKIMFSHRQ